MMEGSSSGIMDTETFCLDLSSQTKLFTSPIKVSKTYQDHAEMKTANIVTGSSIQKPPIQVSLTKKKSPETLSKLGGVKNLEKLIFVTNTKSGTLSSPNSKVAKKHVFQKNVSKPFMSPVSTNVAKRTYTKLTGASTNQVSSAGSSSACEEALPNNQQKNLFFSFSISKLKHIVINGHKNYRCNVCASLYLTKFSLKRHFLRNHVDPFYICLSDLTNCKINSPRLKSLMEDPDNQLPEGHKRFRKNTTHFIEDNSNRVLSGLYKCHICKHLRFDLESELRAHYTQHPSEAYKLVCHFCKLTFNKQQVFSKHMASHKDGRPKMQYNCKRCSLSFPCRADLLEHQVNHSNLYKCKYCPKEFTTSANRKRHEHIHQGSQAYPCKHCPVSYTDYKSLKEHFQAVHSHAFYLCEQCPKQAKKKLFTSEDALQSHKLEKHGTIISPQGTTHFIIAEESSPPMFSRAASHAPIKKQLPGNLTPTKGTATKQQMEVATRKEQGRKFSCIFCSMKFTDVRSLIKHKAQEHKKTRKRTPYAKKKQVIQGLPAHSHSRQTFQKTPTIKGRPPRTIRMSPRIIALRNRKHESEFYYTLADNIAENLTSYVDGKKEHLSLKQFSGNDKYSFISVSEDYNIPWSAYNFPQGYDVSQKGRVVKPNMSEDASSEDKYLYLTGLSRVESSCSVLSSSNIGEVIDDNQMLPGQTQTKVPAVIELEQVGYEPNKDVQKMVFICSICKGQFPSRGTFEEHCKNNHINVDCTCVCIEGVDGKPVEVSQDLLRKQHVSSEGIYYSCFVPPSLSEKDVLICTKCKHLFRKPVDLHSHILSCGGNEGVVRQKFSFWKNINGLTRIRRMSMYRQIPTSPESGSEIPGQDHKMSPKSFKSDIGYAPCPTCNATFLSEIHLKHHLNKCVNLLQKEKVPNRQVNSEMVKITQSVSSALSAPLGEGSSTDHMKAASGVRSLFTSSNIPKRLPFRAYQASTIPLKSENLIEEVRSYNEIVSRMTTIMTHPKFSLNKINSELMESCDSPKKKRKKVGIDINERYVPIEEPEEKQLQDVNKNIQNAANKTLFTFTLGTQKLMPVQSVKNQLGQLSIAFPTFNLMRASLAKAVKKTVSTTAPRSKLSNTVSEVFLKPASDSHAAVSPETLPATTPAISNSFSASIPTGGDKALSPLPIEASIGQETAQKSKHLQKIKQPHKFTVEESNHIIDASYDPAKSDKIMKGLKKIIDSVKDLAQPCESSLASSPSLETTVAVSSGLNNSDNTHSDSNIPTDKKDQNILSPNEAKLLKNKLLSFEQHLPFTENPVSLQQTNTSDRDSPTLQILVKSVTENLKDFDVPSCFDDDKFSLSGTSAPQNLLSEESSNSSLNFRVIVPDVEFHPSPQTQVSEQLLNSGTEIDEKTDQQILCYSGSMSIGTDTNQTHSSLPNSTPSVLQSLGKLITPKSSDKKMGKLLKRGKNDPNKNIDQNTAESIHKIPTQSVVLDSALVKSLDVQVSIKNQNSLSSPKTLKKIVKQSKSVVRKSLKDTDQAAVLKKTEEIPDVKAANKLPVPVVVGLNIVQDADKNVIDIKDAKQITSTPNQSFAGNQNMRMTAKKKIERSPKKLESVVDSHDPSESIVGQVDLKTGHRLSTDLVRSVKQQSPSKYQVKNKKGFTKILPKQMNADNNSSLETIFNKSLLNTKQPKTKKLTKIKSSNEVKMSSQEISSENKISDLSDSNVELTIGNELPHFISEKSDQFKISNKGNKVVDEISTKVHGIPSITSGNMTSSTQQNSAVAMIPAAPLSTAIKLPSTKMKEQIDTQLTSSDDLNNRIKDISCSSSDFEPQSANQFSESSRLVIHQSSPVHFVDEASTSDSFVSDSTEYNYIKENADKLIIKKELEYVPGAAKHQCPFCSIDFSYLTNFRRHLRSCERNVSAITEELLEEGRRLQHLPKKTEVAESMLNLLRNQSRQRTEAGPSDKSPAKKLMSYSCKFCHKMFFKMVECMKHQLSAHLLHKSGGEDSCEQEFDVNVLSDSAAFGDSIPQNASGSNYSEVVNDNDEIKGQEGVTVEGQILPECEIEKVQKIMAAKVNIDQNSQSKNFGLSVHAEVQTSEQNKTESSIPSSLQNIGKEIDLSKNTKVERKIHKRQKLKEVVESKSKFHGKLNSAIKKPNITKKLHIEKRLNRRPISLKKVTKFKERSSKNSNVVESRATGNDSLNVKDPLLFTSPKKRKRMHLESPVTPNTSEVKNISKINISARGSQDSEDDFIIPTYRKQTKNLISNATPAKSEWNLNEQVLIPASDIGMQSTSNQHSMNSTQSKMSTAVIKRKRKLSKVLKKIARSPKPSLRRGKPKSAIARSEVVGGPRRSKRPLSHFPATVTFDSDTEEDTQPRKVKKRRGRNLICPICKKCFTTPLMRTKHMHLKHSRRKPSANIEVPEATEDTKPKKSEEQKTSSPRKRRNRIL